MKILLDENLPHELRHEITGYDVFTVQYMGWSGVKNGLLLSQAKADGFDCLVTLDSGVPYQQNLATLPLSIIVLSAASNDMDDLRPLLDRLHDALKNLKPKTVVHVG